MLDPFHPWAPRLLPNLFRYQYYYSTPALPVAPIHHRVNIGVPPDIGPNQPAAQTNFAIDGIFRARADFALGSYPVGDNAKPPYITCALNFGPTAPSAAGSNLYRRGYLDFDHFGWEGVQAVSAISVDYDSISGNTFGVHSTAASVLSSGDDYASAAATMTTQESADQDAPLIFHRIFIGGTNSDVQRSVQLDLIAGFLGSAPGANNALFKANVFIDAAFIRYPYPL